MTPLILALLPLAVQYIVPAVEKLVGKKKSPTDTTTGDTKMNNVIGIMEQFAAQLAVSGTTDEMKQIAQLAVNILKPLGLDQLSQTGTLSSTPIVLGSYPVTFTGTCQIGAVK